MYFAGVDIGTSGCKCTVFDGDGNGLADASERYGCVREDGRHEIDLTAVMAAMKRCIKAAAAKSRRSPDAICVASFGETFAALDSGGRPVAPSMLYTDSRGAEEAEELCAAFGAREIFRITGHKPGQLYSLPKLMWLQKHCPGAMDQVRLVLPVASLAIYSLTGETLTDYSLASRTLMFDVRRNDWDGALVSRSGLTKDNLPKAVPVGTVAGTVGRKLSEELGLAPSAKVIVGAQDQIIAAIGSDTIFGDGTANGCGSVECVTPAFEKQESSAFSDVFYNNNYAVIPTLAELYVTYAFVYTGSLLLDWFRGIAGGAEPGALDTDSGRPTGILALPHFAGAATPHMDGGSKGAIVGLTLEHTREDIYKALQEGVCYEILLNLRRLKEAGLGITSLRLSGGGTRSRVWNQLRADIYGLPCATLKSREAGAAGAAMLCGVAAGLYASLREAGEKLVSEGEVFEPRPGMTAAYAEQFGRYEKLYKAVGNI